MEKDYKKLCPFKGWVLENFPFIEADFDAITNYELICKIVEYLNKVIDSQNEVIGISDNLVKSFNNLYNYVNDYFDNTDFQQMVNDKLDDMVTDGTLENLINQDLFNGLNNKLNTVTYQKSKFAQNIINGTPQTVLFAGDSLTFGQQPSHDNVAVDHPFPDLLQTFINTWYDSTLVTCLNYGYCGALSSRANSEFNTYLAQSPDVIFWEYGTNDVTQLVSNDTIISNLNTFYQSCINNNIELIVIIPPANYVNVARRQGMRRLHDTLKNYCISRGIIYIDMYEYMQNYYNTLATTHTELQTDNTHFIEYKVFRDAILTELLPIVYKQNEHEYNYIEVDSTPNYVQTNINVVTVDYVNIFKKGLLVTSDTGNTFKMNIMVTKPSILSLAGYKSQNGGKGTFSLDGNSYTIDQIGTGTSASDQHNVSEYFFPIILNAGLHTIELTAITFDTASITRFYLFGFILKEIEANKLTNGYRELDKHALAWSGNETSLNGQVLLRNLNTCNEMALLVGDNNVGFQWIKIYPSIPTRKFYEGSKHSAVVSYNGNVGTLTIQLTFGTNSVTISSDISIPIRKIYLFNNSSHYGYVPYQVNDYSNL